MSGHYEETLKHWRRAFFANIVMVSRHYDERLSACGDSILLVVSVFSDHKLV